VKLEVFKTLLLVLLLVGG